MRELDVGPPGLWSSLLCERRLEAPALLWSNHTKNLFVLPKTMFNGTRIILKFLHDSCSRPELLNVTWYLRSSRCHNEVYINENDALAYLKNWDSEATSAGGGLYVLYDGYARCGHLHEISKLPTPRRLTPLQEQHVPSSVSWIAGNGESRGAGGAHGAARACGGLHETEACSP
ncbi:Transmembrane protein 87A [Varanus komodoensis]|nr:Transmembrane protein 87A [Varanus komodoensis]